MQFGTQKNTINIYIFYQYSAIYVQLPNAHYAPLKEKWPKLKHPRN